MHTYDTRLQDGYFTTVADNSIQNNHLLLGFIIPPRSNSLVEEREPIEEEFPDRCCFGIVFCRLGLGSGFSEYTCLSVGLTFV